MPTFYTTGEVAKMFKVAPGTVWNWVKAGKLKGCYPGDRKILRIADEDLQAFIRESRGGKENPKT